MKTAPPPHPAIDLSPLVYRQLVYTLTGLLPPPIDDSPEALRARNQAAVAKVAALLPVNANEADLAAQCIAARAQAEDMLRQVRRYAADIGLVMRLNAQYGSMVRTSLSVHARLMRVQALRHKREAIDGAADADAWTHHVAEQSMLKVVDPKARPQQAAQPEAAPVEAPAAAVGQTIENSVSKSQIKSHNAAFETSLSMRLRNREPKESAETGRSEMVREALAGLRAIGRPVPANGRESPGRPD
jgi:hypothetical protein